MLVVFLFCFCFFNFLQNHVSQTNRTLQTLSQALWCEGEDSVTEQLPTPEEPYAPLHKGQCEGGVSWRPALLHKGCLSGSLSAKNMWRYPMVMVMPMMTARMRTVTETQMAIMTFFFLAFFWFSRAILTCSCPRST